MVWSDLPRSPKLKLLPRHSLLNTRSMRRRRGWRQFGVFAIELILISFCCYWIGRRSTTTTTQSSPFTTVSLSSFLYNNGDGNIPPTNSSSRLGCILYFVESEAELKEAIQSSAVSIHTHLNNINNSRNELLTANENKPYDYIFILLLEEALPDSSTSSSSASSSSLITNSTLRLMHQALRLLAPAMVKFETVPHHHFYNDAHFTPEKYVVGKGK